MGKGGGLLGRPGCNLFSRSVLSLMTHLRLIVVRSEETVQRPERQKKLEEDSKVLRKGLKV